MRFSDRGRARALLLACVATAGCFFVSEQPRDSGGPLPDVPVEVGDDAAPDALPDVGLDAAPDVAVDAAADAAPDVAPDVSADVSPDVALDAATDVVPDAVPDVPSGCDGGATACGSRCVDTSSDRDHCGACGHRCAIACAASRCVTLTQVVENNYARAAVLSDGTVRAWGNNNLGMLGDGTTTARDVPTPVSGLAGAVEVSLGSGHGCARMTDTTVQCWGNNTSGELGDGTTTSRPTPAPVPGLTGVAQVRAGNGFTCVRMADGTARCWGSNSFGQLGDGTTTPHRTPAPVTGIAGAVDLDNGRSSAVCAVLADHSVQCWGRGQYGILGDGTTVDRPRAGPVTGVNDASRVALGTFHACALLGDATVRCWGVSDRGQTGDGATWDRSTPAFERDTPVAVRGLAGVVELAAGADHTCARLRTGAVWCWGDDSEANLGDGAQGARAFPGPVTGISAATRIAAQCALEGEDQLRCWGRSPLAPPIPRATTPGMVGGLTNVVELSAGRYHACARISDGTVRCWGANTHGQLGDLTQAPHASPAAVSGLMSPARLGEGYGAEGAFAVMTDGSARAWGRDDWGQLGDLGTRDRLAPTTPSGLGTVSQVVAQQGATFAIAADGTVRSWGRNGNLALGDPALPEDGRAAPGVVPGLTGVTQLSASDRHACARLVDGTVRCWGSNESGQLGDGTNLPRATPTAVTGLAGVARVGCGSSHTCAWMDNGTVQCWGADTFGQLGDGATTSRPTPAAVPMLSGVTSLAVGSLHTCASLADNTVRCWGANGRGGLGDGTTSTRSMPVPVSGLTQASAVSAGLFFTCARRTDGSVACWGDNQFGTLGDGRAPFALVPADVVW